MDRISTVCVASEGVPASYVQRLAAIARRHIGRRAPVAFVDEGGDFAITFSSGEGFGSDGCAVSGGNDGVRIAAGCLRGLLYGLGIVLRSAAYGSDGFVPAVREGVYLPDGTVRGMYFAVHFHNWYHVAPPEEVRQYVEDLALWGINSIAVGFPFINLDGWDDGATASALERLRLILRTTRDLGLQGCLMAAPNNLFRAAPERYRAVPVSDPLGRHGNHGVNLCPNAPGVMEFIRATYDRLFEGIHDIGLDFVCCWPYDEGGCGCSACSPWGANGFLTVSKEAMACARRFFPDVRCILSTWTFDTPEQGEWAGLSAALEREPGWVDYILAASHEDYPRYPLVHGAPGGLPLLDFPEISMWGMHPWGGYGATPLPGRIERIWKQARHVLAGGFPYSEGIFEDINKIIMSRLFWTKDGTAESALREYVAYEYSPAATGDILRLIAYIEKSHTLAATGKPVDRETVRAACDLARSVDVRLPRWSRSGWRWRILYLRALLDAERFLGGERLSGEAEEALAELIELYHANPEEDPNDPYHRWVRPPLRIER